MIYPRIIAEDYFPKHFSGLEIIGTDFINCKNKNNNPTEEQLKNIIGDSNFNGCF